MSKELEYEINNFANLLHKDCMNLMECLKKQSEDNKPILYLGKHYEKVILPYEEYQKMCNRLESIDNANPSEALKCLERIIEKTDCMNNTCVHLPKCLKDNKCRYNIDDLMCPDYEMANHIKQYILKAQEQEKLFDDMLVFKNGCLSSCFEYKGKQIVAMLLEEYAEFMEQEKELDIIKEKDVDIFMLRRFKTLEAYNNYAKENKMKQLTEEEFNLLKEVLE